MTEGITVLGGGLTAVVAGAVVGAGGVVLVVAPRKMMALPLGITGVVHVHVPLGVVVREGGVGGGGSHAVEDVVVAYGLHLHHLAAVDELDELRVVVGQLEVLDPALRHLHGEEPSPIAVVAQLRRHRHRGRAAHRLAAVLFDPARRLPPRSHDGRGEGVRRRRDRHLLGLRQVAPHDQGHGKADPQEDRRRRVHRIGVAEAHAGRDARRVPGRPPFALIGFVDTRIPSS